MYTKHGRSMLLASCFCGLVVPVCAASDATLAITGRIDASTCNIEGKPPGSGATKLVSLAGISAGSLVKAGDTAGDRSFNIEVGGNEECKNGLKAMVRFDPASGSIDPATGALKVQPGGQAATNVQIEIANADGQKINLYTSDSLSVVVEDNKASIPLLARYVSLGNATEGLANSSVGFQIVYE